MGGPLSEKAELLVQASPCRQSFQQPPPVLLIHGTDDPLVAYSQSVLMLERLAEAHGWVELFMVPGAGHGLIGGPETLRQMRLFLSRGLSGGREQAPSP